jgi:hypothetical protein
MLFIITSPFVGVIFGVLTIGDGGLSAEVVLSKFMLHGFRQLRANRSYYKDYPIATNILL